MTALEALVPRGPTAAPTSNVHQLHPPAPQGPLRPPRWNMAGYCVMCLDWHCDADHCTTGYNASVWAVCRYCDGSGYDRSTEELCSCTSGLVELTNSAWIDEPRLRPSRLNFAGYCAWCGERWCDNQACIDAHNKSRWTVCDTCDGLGYDDLSSLPCLCAHGLMEAPQ